MTDKRSRLMESESRDLRLRCPKDSTIMEKEQIGGPSGVTVDRCARCGALWLDKGELERILAMGAAKKTDLGPFGMDKPHGPMGTILCPRDQSVMVEVADKVQKHVLIMICTECNGKLLDAGELIDLSEYTMMEKLKAALKLG